MRLWLRYTRRCADPLSFLGRALTKLHSLWVSLTYPFVSVGRGLSMHYTCDLYRPSAGFIKLGSHVIISKDVWLNVSSTAELDQPIITIDDHCSIGRRSEISARNGIHIERDVVLSAGILVIDHNHAFADVTTPIKDQGITLGGRIRIEQGCWIGQGAAIVCEKGELILGRNSVIAANALVTKSCPPYSVVVGNPARVVKQYDPGKGKWALGIAPASSATESLSTVQAANAPVRSIS